jgi:hypothetical protein
MLDSDGTDVALAVGQNRYRVRIVVPPPLRPIIEKESLVQRLATSHRAHALWFATPVIAPYKARLADAASRANYRPKLGVRYIAEWDFNLVRISVSADGLAILDNDLRRAF